MGVNQLWSILEPVKRNQSLSELRGKTLCVDLSGWICEARCAKGLKDNVNKPHLRNLFFRLLHLTRLGVRLVFVVDGKAPELKWQAIAKRIQARNGGHVSKNPRSVAGSARVGRSHFATWVRECCKFLGLLGFPCIESSGEAEALCAWLDHQKIVDGCITNDGDAFLYGAQTVYKDICITGKDASVECYRMEEIEAKLDLNREKLVALAILLGCDYLPQGVPGVGKEIGMKLIRSVDCDNLIDRLHAWRKGTLLEESLSTVEKLVKRKALKEKNFPHPKVIQEFLAPNIVTQKVSLRIACPYLKDLQEFCLKNLDWPEEYTRAKVLPLVTYWQMTSFSKRNNDLLIRPERIVKARIQQRVECYEVEWQNIKVGETCPNLFTTIETRELFAKVYPEVVKEFSNREALRTRKSKMKKTQCNDSDKDVDLLTEHLEGLTFTGSSALCSSPSEASLDDETLQDIINTVLPASSDSDFQQSKERLTTSKATWACHANTAADGDDVANCDPGDDCCEVKMHSKVKTVCIDPLLCDVFESSDEDDNPQNQIKGLSNLAKSPSMSKDKCPFGSENAIGGITFDDRDDNKEAFIRCASKSSQYPGLAETRTVHCNETLKSNDYATDNPKANPGKKSHDLTHSSTSSGLTAFHRHRRPGAVFESSHDTDRDHSSSDSLKPVWSLAPSVAPSFARSSDGNDVVDLCPQTHCYNNYGSIFEEAPTTTVTQRQKEVTSIKTPVSGNGNLKSTRNVLQPRSGSIDSMNNFSSRSKSVEYHDIAKCDAAHLDRIQNPDCSNGRHEQLSIKESFQAVSPSHDYLSVPLSKRLERQFGNRKRLLILQSISSATLGDE